MQHPKPRSRRPAVLLGRSRSFSFVALLVLLASCGGGGGGGGSTPGAGSGSGGGFAITLDRSSMSFTYYEGAVPPSQPLNASATGTPPGGVYVGALAENFGPVNAIQPELQLSISGTQASTLVSPLPALAAGVYTGRVVFLACSDANCSSNPIGGTPLAVSFTVNVLRAVQATPTGLSRTVTSGGGIVEDFVVVPGENETSFSIGQTLAFVQVSNQNAGGFRVTLPSLPAGQYNASIPLTGSSGSQRHVPIAYTVRPPPGGERPITVNPSGLTFTTSEGASALPQVFEATEASWRPGFDTPTIEYREGQNWLQVSNAPSGYQVVANAANLTAGTYTALIFVRVKALPAGVSEPFPPNQPVYVSLTVGPGFVRPADVLQVIDSEGTAAALDGNVDIDVVGGPQVTWNAVSDVPWLTIDNPSGLTGTELRYSIDSAWLATAQNFVRRTATIRVTAPGTPLTPIEFAVNVEPRLAEVSGVGPRVVLANQATELVVSGRGFAAITNPGARVAVTGAVPTVVQRVNDRKLVLQFASLGVGSHQVSVSNALGIATASRGTVARVATPHAYATVATGQSIDALIVDHERDVLYGVHRNSLDPSLASLSDGRAYRFTPGASWTATDLGITAVDDIGVLLDGDLIAITSPGTISVHDPAAPLPPKFSLNLACTGLRQGTSGGIAVTLEGRAWLATSNNLGCAGTPRWGRLGSFDPVARTFSLLPIPESFPFPFSFGNGPDFVMARNGERLILRGQSATSTVYLDASESVLKLATAGDWGSSASASDDGSRVVLDLWTVLDEHTAVIGTVDLPDYTAPPSDAALSAAVISPDGDRLYVLAFRDSDRIDGGLTDPPRVYVLDTTAPMTPPTTPFPILGYFEIADFPSCITSFTLCDLLPAAAISLDGKTLFFAGNERLVVAPIPAVLTPL